MKAASGGHADCVKLLLDSGAQADQQVTVRTMYLYNFKIGLITPFCEGCGCCMLWTAFYCYCSTNHHPPPPPFLNNDPYM